MTEASARIVAAVSAEASSTAQPNSCAVLSGVASKFIGSTRLYPTSRSVEYKVYIGCEP